MSYVYSYDKEYLSSLTREDKINYSRNFVNDLVVKLNNPELIKKDESPNANIIYHLYSDGTITRQKGGWAYLKRSLTDIYDKCINKNNFFTFPYKGNISGDTYAIIELENCIKIRKLIFDICKDLY
jgi:hypothetical protein